MFTKTEHLKIAPSILCQIIPETTISQTPRWMLDGRNVLIGPYHSSEEHEQHISQTVGSTDWLWSAHDELRFDRESLLLQSILFIVPDATLPPDLSLDVWQMAPQETGLLKLLQAQKFPLEPADFRWMDPQGQALICATKNALDASQRRFRLHINEDMDLFFINEQFCGWALLHPARFIVDAWEAADETDDDTQFVALLSDYLALVTDPFIEQMEDRDAHLLERLRDLYARITQTSRSDKRYTVLRTAVADKIDRFYDMQMN
jgi:hypothetical protein